MLVNDIKENLRFLAVKVKLTSAATGTITEGSATMGATGRGTWGSGLAFLAGQACLLSKSSSSKDLRWLKEGASSKIPDLG